MSDFGEQPGPSKADIAGKQADTPARPGFSIDQGGGSGKSDNREGRRENEPKVNIIITRSPEDLERWRKAAEYAGGTTIEELPGDDATVEEFVAARDAEDYPGVDIATTAREALQSGATMIRVTEDTEWRRTHPGDVYNYHHGLKTGTIRDRES